MKKICTSFVVLYIIGCFFQVAFVAAASPLDSVAIGSYVPVGGKNLDDGTIVTLTEKGYTLTTIAYDQKIVGIINTSPAISLSETSEKKGVPIVSSGIVAVKVIGTNGSIKVGDFITSSTTPGLGMKANQSGFVIGEATQNLTLKKLTDVGLVKVHLNFHNLSYGGSFLSDFFNIVKVASYDKPSRTFQYLVAALIVIASFAFGFLIYTRAVNTGIEALGRNPLAGRRIQLSIVLNLMLIVIVVITGVGLAYIMIRL